MPVSAVTKYTMWKSDLLKLDCIEKKLQTVYSDEKLVIDECCYESIIKQKQIWFCLRTCGELLFVKTDETFPHSSESQICK